MTPLESKVKAKELQLLNSQRTQVQFHGESMKPLLEEGDKVVVRKVDFCDIRIGDIIVSYEGDKYPARRVLRKKKDGLIVWRDNWARRKIITISSDNVLGLVISRKRNNIDLTQKDLVWRLYTIWAFVRFIPGRVFTLFNVFKYFVSRSFIHNERT